MQSARAEPDREPDPGVPALDPAAEARQCLAAPDEVNPSHREKGQRMKKSIRLVVGLGLVLAMVATAAAQGGKAPQGGRPAPADRGPGAAGAEAITIVAKVESVDVQARRLTVKGPEGRTATISVPKRVRNFDQIKPGDEVSVTYVEAWSIRAKKPGEPSATETGMIATAKPGQKPAGVIVDERTVTATVESVDVGKRMLTLKGPEGKTFTVPVRRAKNLDKVKAGDAVELKLVEGLAVQVEKPQK
jgi:hypothetical protein